MKTDKNKIIKLYENIILNCANENFYSVWNCLKFNGDSIRKVIKDIGLKEIYSISRMRKFNNSYSWNSYYIITRDIKDKETLGDYNKIMKSLNKSFLVKNFDNFVLDTIKRFFASLAIYETKCYKYFRFKSCDGVKRSILSNTTLNNYKSNKVRKKDLYNATTSSFALYCLNVLPKKVCVDYLKYKYHRKNVPYAMCYRVSERFGINYMDIRKIGFKKVIKNGSIESVQDKINKGQYREAINDMEENILHNKDHNIYQLYDLIYSILFQADKKDLLFLIGIMSEITKYAQIDHILDLFNYKLSQ